MIQGEGPTHDHVTSMMSPTLFSWRSMSKICLAALGLPCSAQSQFRSSATADSPAGIYRISKCNQICARIIPEKYNPIFSNNRRQPFQPNRRPRLSWRQFLALAQILRFGVPSFSNSVQCKSRESETMIVIVACAGAPN